MRIGRGLSEGSEWDPARVGEIAAAAPARADVTCSVVEIEASTGTKPSVDGELRQFEKRFKRPPYSSWNTFKRLGGTTATLAPQSESDVQLVHGKVGMLLRDVIERSGKQCWTHWRWNCPKFLRETFHEFAKSSIPYSPWAEAYYDLQ